MCSGVGGLDRAVSLAIPSARTVLYVERGAFNVANLVSQMEAGVVAQAPVWSDARSVPGRRFRGRVDGVIGGIPCQEWSLAGTRKGDTGERDLWAPFRRTVVQSGAWFCLIENVQGILSAGKGKMPGAERIRRDLRRMGFTVTAGIFRASEMGLPHERQRVFILGVRNDFACRAGIFDRLAHAGHAGHAGLQGGFSRLNGEGAEGQERVYVAGRGRDVENATHGRCGRKANDGQPSGSPDGSISNPANADIARRTEAGCRPEIDTGQQSEPGCGDVGNAKGDGWRSRRPKPTSQRWVETACGSSRTLEHSIGCGCDGQPQDPEREAERRDALEWASRGPIAIPGPSDRAGWAWIANHFPERLPAVSRHDLFGIEVGAARNAAYGDPAARPRQAWGNSSAASWVDENGPFGLRAAIVQEIAQSTLRKRSDGMATRTDELRSIGNGVADPCGALAVIHLVTGLGAATAPASELLRRLVK